MPVSKTCSFISGYRVSLRSLKWLILRRQSIRVLLTAQFPNYNNRPNNNTNIEHLPGVIWKKETPDETRENCQSFTTDTEGKAWRWSTTSILIKIMSSHSTTVGYWWLVTFRFGQNLGGMKLAQALDFRDHLRKTPLALCSPVRNTIYFDLQPRLYYRCEHTSKIPFRRRARSRGTMESDSSSRPAACTD